MRWPAVAIAFLGAVLGGWLLFDGLRSLTVGDFVTARSGPHAGRLGPWADVLRQVGIDPHHVGVKLAHVVLGLWWLGAVASVLLRLPWSRWAVIGVAVASLWYLPFGTVLGGVALVLAVAYLR